MTDGTTLCPYCNTRFRITAAQQQAHEGMVRCGHCLQAFDSRHGYVPDEPDPQLELLIAETSAETLPGATLSAAPGPQLGSALALEETSEHYIRDNDIPELIQPAPQTRSISTGPEIRDRATSGSQQWLWGVGAFLLFLALLAQTAYYFRGDLAARLPRLKPALTAYCQVLQCSIPLPQEVELLSIESSGLETDPANEHLITLSAVLRNRAGFPQAFPDLELTLNDPQDQPLARRTFHPREYLPPGTSAAAGLAANQELAVKLHLDTTDLTATGYRLELHYPGG